MTTRKKCDQCGAKDLQRQFYIWRREDLDDPEAFDIEGAEPTDMGSDYWCDHCEAHTFGIDIECEHDPMTYTKHPTGDIATRCRKCKEVLETEGTT